VKPGVSGATKTHDKSRDRGGFAGKHKRPDKDRGAIKPDRDKGHGCNYRCAPTTQPANTGSGSAADYCRDLIGGTQDTPVATAPLPGAPAAPAPAPAPAATAPAAPAAPAAAETAPATPAAATSDTAAAAPAAAGGATTSSHTTAPAAPASTGGAAESAPAGGVLGATDSSSPTREREAAQGGVLADSAAAAQQSAASSLPFTGLDVWMIGGAGLLVLLAGLIGRRAATRRS
jgi:hypothetical protein